VLNGTSSPDDDDDDVQMSTGVGDVDVALMWHLARTLAVIQVFIDFMSQRFILACDWILVP